MEKLENMEEAKTYLQKAIDLDPENSSIRTKLNELNRKVILHVD